MSSPRPYALLAELTHRCPLHCPYCSNPCVGVREPELDTDEWRAVLSEAAELGVVQVGFSGGEPLLRPDLEALVAHARHEGLYTNLLTSGVGLSRERAIQLHEAGLDSLQLSFQADEAELGDRVAGARVHELKESAAAIVREAGLPLTANVVLHRHNVDRLEAIVAFIATTGAHRLELAHAQYYGWAWENRLRLLPSRSQVEAAETQLPGLRTRFRDTMEIVYVPSDYYEDRPKPCLYGWGQTHLTVAPSGAVLPCPTAWSIAGMVFENVRSRTLAEIWSEASSFNRYRGTGWLPEPCRSCPEHAVDFGGCRCQAALMTGDAGQTDPVCAKAPTREQVDRVIAEAAQTTGTLEELLFRQNPPPLRSSKELPKTG